MDFAAPLVTTSEIADERSYDVVLNPVKTLDAASEMVGVSASVLNPVKTLPMTSEGTTLSSANFPAPLLMLSLNAEARLSAVLRNPVKALVTLSDIVDTEFSEIARAPVNIRSMTSEGTRLTSGNFPAPFLTESAIETTSDRDFATPLFTTPEIADARLSDVVLNPVKSLPTTSEGTTLSSGNFPAPFLTESAIETTSDMDLATPLFTTPEIADARLSDVVLNPVKTLSAASETLGVSESVLNPVKTLPMTSEGTTLRNGNFPAPLLTEAAIAEARFCDVLRNPVKTLSRASDTADTESSEIARAPVKTLLATSEGTRVSSGNFPTSFLTEAAIAEARFCDVLRNPVKALSRASDTAATESSEIARAPVKTLLATSDGTRLSSGNFPTSLLTEAATETTTDMDLATPLFTTPEIADARFSDVVLNPVKALDAASDKVGVSESVLNPVKTLPTTSEDTTLRNGNFPAPLLTEAAIADARLSDVLRNPVNALVTLSDIEDTELSEIARAPVNTLPTTSECTTLRSGNFPAPLFSETATETTSDRDLATPLFITSAIIDPKSSDVVLNP